MITTRKPNPVSFASWGLVVAAVIGITLIGQLRSQASEPGTTLPLLSVQAPTSAGKLEVASRAVDVTRDDESDSVGEDELQLVPAIYAWDPDVRFVYFRHVSKWM